MVPGIQLFFNCNLIGKFVVDFCLKKWYRYNKNDIEFTFCVKYIILLYTEWLIENETDMFFGI